MFHNVAGLTGEVELSAEYTWEIEIDRLASRLEPVAGQEIYLLGISAGATLALAYIARHPDTIAGLGLIEPAWSYLPLTDVERRYYAAIETILELPPDQQRDAFVRLLVQSEVQPPPVTATAQRGYLGVGRPQDTGLAIVTRAMQHHFVDTESLRAFRGPVYLAVGERSSPMWQAQAAQIKAALTQTIIEVYPHRHHLDAPHHAEAARLSRSLIETWNLNRPSPHARYSTS
jgi:pimeloyl-ACP methyl ester carboxylesterase